MLTQRTNSDYDSLGDVKRQLRRWVVRQSVFAGIVVWGVVLFVTHPRFGMGGPNYPLATLFALAAVGMVALVGVHGPFCISNAFWLSGTARLLGTGWGWNLVGT